MRHIRFRPPDNAGRAHDAPLFSIPNFLDAYFILISASCLEHNRQHFATLTAEQSPHKKIRQCTKCTNNKD